MAASVRVKKLRYLSTRIVRVPGAFPVGCSPVLPQASPAVLTHEQWRVTCVPHSAAPVATAPAVRVRLLYCDICFASVCYSQRKKEKNDPGAFRFCRTSFLLPGPFVFPTAFLSRCREFGGDNFEASLRRLSFFLLRRIDRSPKLAS